MGIYGRKMWFVAKNLAILRESKIINTLTKKKNKQWEEILKKNILNKS